MIQEGVRPADLQDGAEKRVQSLPYSTAHIEAQQSGAALFPEEEPGCIVPPGTADNSPPFQRWDKRRSITPQVPEGRLTIAHRFNGGRSGGLLSPQVPEGRLTIAHRFNGGTSGGLLFPRVPEGRLRPYPKTCFSRPSGTGYGKRRAFSHH